MGKRPVTAIIMAMMLEAKPFVEGMNLNKSAAEPFVTFQNKNILLIISGIGKANAAKATVYCCQKFNPAYICNLGAAGATDFSYSLGEIFHINKIFDYARPEFNSKSPHIHKPHILSHFNTAKLATCDKAVLDPGERKKIARHAGLVDMEGASVAQACGRFKTKCILFKYVSDTPKHTSDKEIVKNIRLYRTPFYDFFHSSVLPVLL